MIWRRHETQNGMDFISVILTEMKFQTGMRFSSTGAVFNDHVCLKLNADMDLDGNEISC